MQDTLNTLLGSYVDKLNGTRSYRNRKNPVHAYIYIYTAQKKYDYMSLYAFFYYADLYIIVEYGIFLKKIQFPVQWGANHEATTIVEDTAARWMTYPPISKVTK